MTITLDDLSSDASEVNAHMDGLRVELQDAVDAQERVEDWHYFNVDNIDNTTEQQARQMLLTMYDDMELVTLIAKGAAASSVSCTLTLEAVDDAGNVIPGFFPNDALSITFTVGTSITDSRIEWDDSTSVKHWLLAGVTYRLTFTVNAAVTVYYAMGQMILGREARR